LGDCRGPELIDYTLQFSNDPAHSSRLVDGQEFIEIADLVIPAPLEPFPDLWPDLSVVLEYGSGVVELVGSRDELDISRLISAAFE